MKVIAVLRKSNSLVYIRVMFGAGGKLKIEVSSDDLVLFADRLIEKAMEAKALMMEQTPEDETWQTVLSVLTRL